MAPPKKWGKHGWKFMHYVALSYPENPTIDDKILYYDFFNNFGKVLPCGKCKNNFKDHLKKYPLTNEVLSSRNNLVKWTIDMHNIVNYYTGKKMLTYQEALNEIYKDDDNNCKLNWIHWIIFGLAIIMIVLVIYYFYRKNNNR
ncbi:putative FAD-linked sulfhydryl oxidase [Cotonvirus japonicus]|uniref:Sulfhydryl oxidase n=1 Tax=Cotonvirus japonicus TaxID=2811091 RepID=A0ABM7NSP8_9VIRU|nr:putative FAD-linked sulfhydryl oxidase [Cotonvirus japonicus]BCS83192.1 putative FAD-linked sulfhydryl oxidase [Cotonvirus japonicus]